jgi:hypothetical protein
MAFDAQNTEATTRAPRTLAQIALANLRAETVARQHLARSQPTSREGRVESEINALQRDLERTSATAATLLGLANRWGMADLAAGPLNGALDRLAEAKAQLAALALALRGYDPGFPMVILPKGSFPHAGAMAE